MSKPVWGLSLSDAYCDIGRGVAIENILGASRRVWRGKIVFFNNSNGFY